MGAIITVGLVIIALVVIAAIEAAIMAIRNAGKNQEKERH
jgi:archaellin